MATLKLFFVFIACLAISGCYAERRKCNANLKEQTNKKIVLDFYQKLFKEKKFEVIDKYIDAGPENFIEHSPYVADGRKALKKYFVKQLCQEPWDVEILRFAAEGDLVFVHAKFIYKIQGIFSSMDIYRLHNGKIKEHWDVVQALPEKSANAHPLF